ncbi:F-box/LRR-repeat protein At3g26922 isoform X2 [Brachypodium distachyon]|uniref:F-box domain-containing protein n=1 Tax=Brachypodium distachyon TaxID=15368 RepID=A0A0Q3ENC1_BRADI|nr:F-box/LRR-repeat protein At3g26922 isoform X2 [Brachypodium distachyon]KQJ89023.1 hypothetical protein BRADI_4g23030v3 [Brachypodium distachyon]PNT63968.1 hypothetical protein BRADI_4g23030v3 [Brachypodium distachyon]|eukprot:XP_014757700.1 F-box/LRR-repeat protein At3g26922 isoform X2 [Brachypodium distachyon]
MASGADRISALPEEALLHVLAFLPAHEAVQTSVLARRWRHLWRSVPRLCIVQQDRFDTIEEMDKFVNHLLHLRDHSSALEECRFEVKSYFQEDCKHVDLWLRQALCCQVRSLLFDSYSLYELSVLGDTPLISQRLRKLHLDSVRLKGCFLDFSCCPVLEDLKMVSCSLDSHRLSSKSLKWLSITHSDFEFSTHACIYAPSLLSLEIADLDEGLCPLLESMPSLVSAFIRVGRSCEDYTIMDDDDPSVVLDGLSDASNLELTVEAGKTFAPFRCTLIRDFRWCPTFSNLKTLLLKEWFLAANVNVLICFLKYSPILEKLTLQLCKEGRSIPSVPREYCSASKHLKIVQVKCNEIDEMVREVVKVLSSCGVPSDHVNVQQWKSRSSSFSFEQKE